LRAVALGRKNYLFTGSNAGGERTAAMYTLIGSAKLNGIDPETYMSHVLTRIADHPINRIEELLPWYLGLPRRTDTWTIGSRIVSTRATRARVTPRSARVQGRLR
jgi:hypothetical protein